MFLFILHDKYHDLQDPVKNIGLFDTTPGANTTLIQDGFMLFMSQ